MQQSMLPLGFFSSVAPAESRGVVYTKPWVVELLLDLAGYHAEANLVDSFAIEPAAGEGAFLNAMVRRLVASCRRQNRDISDCVNSLVAYEIHDVSAQRATDAVIKQLDKLLIDPITSSTLAHSWVKTGDFLLDSAKLPKADFVIGNPPYIRLEEIPEETVAFYRNAFPTMRGRADIYVAFFEASLRRLNQDGVCAFICADRWMLNQYGSGLRELITSKYSVETIVEMHNADAFDDDVSAYPAITIIRSTTQGKVVVATARNPIDAVDTQSLASSLSPINYGIAKPHSSTIVTSAVVDKWFQGTDPWPCSSPKRLALIRQLEDRFAPLELDRETRVGIGVATGCDHIFITQNKDIVEVDRLLPLALAADTITGEMKWSGSYLIDPWDAGGLVNLSRFPKLQEYFEKHKLVLSKRHTAQKSGKGWFKTIDRVTHALRAQHKLYIPDIKNVFNPVLDRGETYPHHNLYYVVSDSWDLEVLGGLLLSSVAQLFIEAYGVRMRGGYLRFQAQYLRRIRVPNPRQVTKEQANDLIMAFRSRDRELATKTALNIYQIASNDLEAAIGH
jgi:hypothetical protein